MNSGEHEAPASRLGPSQLRVPLLEMEGISKRFGATDGHKFVNGVLDKLAAVLRAAELQKR